MARKQMLNWYSEVKEDEKKKKYNVKEKMT